MRCSVLAFVVVAIVAGTASGACAQSVVDLSRPPAGKSRFVLNADMTPADLGVPQGAKPLPVAAPSRVPACGEGCTLDPPLQQRAGAATQPQEDRSGTSRGRTVAVFGVGGYGAQNADPAKARPVAVGAHARKDGTQVNAHTRSAPSFSFRRRR